MEKTNDEHIISVLDEFVSEHKKELIDQVLSKRTRQFTLAFEDIDKPHNISAVLRTAECLGIQDLHFIKNKNDYEINPTITQGAAKWLTLNHYSEHSNNVDACYDKLHSDGYLIYATTLHKESIPVEQLDTTQKLAIVFGTEADGISEEAGQKADGYVHVPMNGFTESFNLSVTAALILSTLLNSPNTVSHLLEDEKLNLKSEWYRKVVREADLILKTKGVSL